MKIDTKCETKITITIGEQVIELSKEDAVKLYEKLKGDLGIQDFKWPEIPSTYPANPPKDTWPDITPTHPKPQDIWDTCKSHPGVFFREPQS